MEFKKAFKLMKTGAKIKLPSWGGYWYWDDEKRTVIMHTKDDQELDIRETDRVITRYQIFLMINGKLQMKKIVLNSVEWPLLDLIKLLVA